MSIRAHFVSCPVTNTEYRDGSSCTIWKTEDLSCIQVDGGKKGSGMLKSTIAFVKSLGIGSETHFVTHGHPDHDGGLAGFLDADGIRVNGVVGPPPEDLKTLDADDYKRYSALIKKAKDWGRNVIHPAANVWTTIKVGSITVMVWRPSDLKIGSEDRWVNNTSMQIYIPELRLWLPGDTIIADKVIPILPGPVAVVALPHHANAFVKLCCQLIVYRFAPEGCVFISDDMEPGGTIGKTGFTATGAAKAIEAGFTVLGISKPIDLSADNGTVTVKQGSNTWRFTTGTWEKSEGNFRWRYILPDGAACKPGWTQVGNKWYCFEDLGYSITGWYDPAGNPDEQMRYLDPSDKGAMIINAWKQIDGSWYHFDGYGRLQTGWITTDNKWYYLDPDKGGAMATARFVNNFDGIHYVDSWGIMQQNCIIRHNGKQYYANGYGVILTGWIEVAGKWYFADEDGAFVTGWFDPKGRPDTIMRYLEPAMVVNDRRTIDGKTYSFDGYGRLIGQTEIAVTGKLTEVSAVRQKFVIDIATYVRKYAPQYGVKVYSPIIAQAIHESGWGESSLTAKYHNYFGLKCGTLWKGKSVNLATKEEYTPGTLTNITANFRVYDNMEEGVKGYFVFLFDGRTRYDNLKGVTDPKTYLQRIKDDGYATGSSYATNCMKLVDEYSLTQFDVAVSVGSTYPRKDIVSLAQSLVGVKEGDTIHHRIIDKYNSRKPLPRGYAVKYTDPWCATFCSYLAIASGYTEIIPIECGCPQWITLAKGMEIWVESDGFTPKPGDFILYDWQDSGSGDNTGTPDHIGVVEKVQNGNITVIEGNYNDMVKRREIAVNGKNIRGFVTPKYTD